MIESEHLYGDKAEADGHQLLPTFIFLAASQCYQLCLCIVKNIADNYFSFNHLTESAFIKVTTRMEALLACLKKKLNASDRLQFSSASKGDKAGLQLKPEMLWNQMNAQRKQ